MGLQPNQTGPLNIAGGLEGEGNDLGSHHTSLETEIHHRQTDRRTDKSWGEPTSLSVLSPLHPLKKKVKHWLCRPQPTHPPIAAFVGLPSATGSPKTTSYGSSLTLVCSWQLRALFLLPSASSSLSHLLPPTRTFPLSCSLLSGLLAPGLLGEAAGTFLLARAPLGPVCPARGAHTAAPLSLRSGAERCRRIRGGVVYGG